MMAPEAPRRRKLSWAAIAVWAVSALAIVAAIGWVVYDAPRSEAAVVPAAALRDIIPSEPEMAELGFERAIDPVADGSWQEDIGLGPFRRWVTEWSSEDNTHSLNLDVEVHQSADAAFLRFELISGLARTGGMPHWKARLSRVGDHCEWVLLPLYRCELYFSKANVVVIVSILVRDPRPVSETGRRLDSKMEGLAWELARLVESKIHKALSEPQDRQDCQ